MPSRTLTSRRLHSNQLLGRNDLAQAAGYYSKTANGSGPFVPYIYDINGGVFEVITIPGSVSAQATDINLKQQVTGFFIDHAKGSTTAGG